MLVHATAGGPGGAQLFNQCTVAIETACLLVSSYTCGLMSLAINSRNRLGTYLGAVITFVLGAAFLALEIREFADMIARGATPQRSAFLSAFFTLVGCHGLHVTLGLIWLVVMMVQVAVMGFRRSVQRRLLCFSLFWHALDIVWVGVFTVVYLMGVSSMTEARYDRAPGDRLAADEMQASAPSGSSRLHDRPASGRPSHRDVVLGCEHDAALASRRSRWASPSSPSPRWASIWCSSCTSPPGRTTPTTCWRSLSACSSSSSWSLARCGSWPI